MIADLPASKSDCESKHRILAAAYPLFVAEGYKAVSMQQIADTVQINKATLYHHFRSKDDLFLEVVRRALGQLRDCAEDVMRGGGSVADQFMAIADRMFVDARSDFGRLMMDAHENLPKEHWHMLLRDDLYPWDLFQQMVQRAIASGEIPETDPELVVTLFLGLVFGQTWARRIGRVETSLDRDFAACLVDFLFAGLRASSRTDSLTPLR
jgi:AcrR family transcriptional regulator